MSQSIREPVSLASACAGMPAGVAALMRWYPDVSLRLFERLRASQPGYPLIRGGREAGQDASSQLAGAMTAQEVA